MKKNLLAISALSLSMVSGAAMATAGNIQFLGSVTTKTCDIVTDVSGASKNTIQLGTAAVSGKATAVAFALKLKDSACDLTGMTNADFTFASASMGATGLANSGGTATGAWAKLSSVNAATPGDITASAQTATVTTTNLKADGAKFTAELNAGATAGTYISEVSYAVAYK